MRRITNILLLLSFSLATYAQTETQVRIFVENSFEGESGTIIKWLPRKGYFPKGVNLYKKVNNGSWVKVNKQAILPNLNESNSKLNNDDEAKNFIKGLNQLSYSEFQESIFKGFVLIKTINNNAFAEAVGSLYKDQTTVNGEKVVYKIAAIENGTDIDLGQSEEFLVGNYSAPQPPKNIKHQLDTIAKAVKFGWDIEELRFYGAHIYRSEDGGAFEPLNLAPIVPTASQTDSGKVYAEYFFTDKNMIEGKTYAYQLAVTDFFGQLSGFSEKIEFPNFDLSFPIAPTQFKLESNAKNLSVDLSWQMDSLPSDLKGFQVYRQVSGDKEIEKVGLLLGKDAKAYSEKLSGSGGYYYYVSSVDESGNESPSNRVFVELRDIVPPSIPLNFKVVVDTGKFKFSWDKVSEKDLAGYYIYRSLADEDNTDNKFVPMGSEPIDSNGFELKMSKNVRATYAYAVVSADTNFNRSKLSQIALAKLPDAEPPKTPVIKNVSKKDSVIVIEWLANVDSDLKGYHIYRKVAEDTVEFKQLNFSLLPAISTSYTDKQTKNGVKYAYAIQAVDENDLQSDFSNIFKGMLPALPPDIKVEGLKGRANQKKKSIRLDWQAAEDEEALVGYTVYRLEQGKAARPVSGLTNSLRFVDNGLKPGTYDYEIRSYSKTGDVFKSEAITIEIKNLENK